MEGALATPNERLAASLTELQKLQQDGRRVFRSDELTRVHRARLLQQRFLQEVMRGWLICADPDGRPGDSTPWFASLCEFCARYCETRFGDDWHLGAEQSLMLHAENTVVPTQVLIYSSRGSNNNVSLLFGTSLYDFKEKALPSRTELVMRDDLRLFSLEAGLVRVPPAFFTRSPIEAQVCLSAVRDPSPLLALLLGGGHSVVAGRLAGAFRHIGRGDIADEVVAGMTAATYRVTETNPFNSKAVNAATRNEPAIVGRLRTMWGAARSVVLERFPAPPGLPADPTAYLERIDEIYVSDAYHSLSIEGYRVTPDLIERVRFGGWDPKGNERDRKDANALAARGYWQAFQAVKETVDRILAGGNAAALCEQGLRVWYREMLQPGIAAGAVPVTAMAGYRSGPAYLRTSRYIPPRAESLRDAMEGLFALLREEPEPAVRAVLGHWMIGFIHPFPDGNGRSARFLMNAMLASGGYPWTIIRHEDRATYLESLDRASIDIDLRPFTDFIAERVRCSSSTDSISQLQP